MPQPRADKSIEAVRAVERGVVEHHAGVHHVAGHRAVEHRVVEHPADLHSSPVLPPLTSHSGVAVALPGSSPLWWSAPQRLGCAAALASLLWLVIGWASA
jgi:hypothetical protein